MGLLTAACVFLGLFPTLFLTLLAPLTQQLIGQPLPAYLIRGDGWVLGSAKEMGGTVSTLGIALMGICLLPIPLVLWLFFGRRTQVRIGPTWDCGLRGLTPQMEYTATGFSKPIRMIFKALFRPRREVQREYDYSPYFAKTLRFESHIEEAFVTRLYRPLNRAILRLSRTDARVASREHTGLPHLHLRHAVAAAAVCAMSAFLAVILQTLLLLALAPLISGCIRNWKAKLQNRRGPRIWQPYYDLVKFLRKDMVISEHASWIFRAMPYVLFTSTLLAGLMMPLVNVSAPLSLFGGALAFVGLLALGRFFLALGGLDPASAFGGMGSSREMTIAAVAEPALMLAIFTVAITAGSTNLSQMLLAAQGPTWRLLNPAHVLAFAALFIVLLAETGRLPVDNPATHLELTMIHEAMILEYSGRYLALIEWSAAVKQLVLMALLVNIFFPVGIATDLSAACDRVVVALVYRQAAGPRGRGGAGGDHQRQAAPVPRAGSAERGLHSRHAGPAFHVPVPVI